MHKRTRLNRMAGMVIFGVIILLTVRLWTGVLGLDMSGPDQLAAVSDALYVHMHNHMYRLDKTGRLTLNATLTDLGFKQPPADFQILEKGGVLIGSIDHRLIYACDPDLSRCDVLVKLPPKMPTADKTERNGGGGFFFDMDQNRRCLFVSDVAQSKLLLIETNKEEAHTLVDGQDLFHPMAVCRKDADSVLVADAYNGRVADILIDANKFRAFGNDFPGKTPFSRDGHTLPVDLVKGPQGDWWIINRHESGLSADLVVYSDTGLALRRVDLPGAPMSVAASDGYVFAADPVAYRVYRINPQNDRYEVFGDPAFIEMLDAERDKRDTYRRISQISFWAMLPLALLCIYVATAISRLNRHENSQARRNREAAAVGRTQTAGPGAAHWIRLAPNARRRHRIMLIVFQATVIGIALAAVVTIAYITCRLKQMDLETGLTLLVFVVAPGIVLRRASSFLPGPACIGCDNRFFYYFDDSEQKISVPPEEISYTSSAIHTPGGFIPLSYNRWLTVYRQDDLAVFLFPFLARARKISELKSVFLILQRDPALMVAFVVLVGFWLVTRLL